MSDKADLVLEGGGTKGLGLLGAVTRLMEQGYTFPRVAGTSAGSILAAFLAAGVDAAGIVKVMGRLDYLTAASTSFTGDRKRIVYRAGG